MHQFPFLLPQFSKFLLNVLQFFDLVYQNAFISIVQLTSQHIARFVAIAL